MADSDYRAWVEVLPDFSQFNARVGDAVIGGMGRAGEKGSEEMGEGLIAGVGKFAGPLIVALGALAIGAAIAGQVKAGIDAGIEYSKQAVAAAADLEQSQGAVEAVFKSSAGQIKAWGEQSAETVGLSKNDYFELSTVIGAQLKNLGVPIDEVAGQTNNLVELGADLSAQFGGSTSDAVSALSSLLRGERDPIERYGVSIKEADVAAEKAAMGLGGLTGEADKQAGIFATLEILSRQTADAQGTFAKESDTLLGSQQRLDAALEDVTARFGQELLPIITDVMTFVRDELLPIWEALNDTMGPALQTALSMNWESLKLLWDELSRLFEVLLPEGVNILTLLAAAIITVALMLSFGIEVIAAYAAAWADFFAFLRGDITLDELVSNSNQRMQDLVTNFNTRIDEAGNALSRINDIANGLSDASYLAGLGITSRLADGLTDGTPAAEQAMYHAMEQVGLYLPRSPAKRGPFSGSGWDNIKHSGEAILGQLASGMGHIDVPLSASIKGTSPVVGLAAAAADGLTSRGAPTVEQNITLQDMDPVVMGTVLGRELASRLRRQG